MKTSEVGYIAANRQAYDALAHEYRKRATVDRLKDIRLVDPFISHLKSTFGAGCRVLDIGPGNGVNLSMFYNVGLSVVGIDISPKMLEVARDICPSAELHLGDFLEVPFAGSSFHGVFAKASIHCLPKIDAMRAFHKTHKILVPGGIFYVTTTASMESSEGFYSKEDYPGGYLRFRKRWTPEELAQAVTDSGFIITKDNYDHEPDWNKHWYNIWAIKRPSAERSPAPKAR